MQLLHRQTNGKISYSGALQSYQYMYHAYITHVLSYSDPLRIPLKPTTEGATSTWICGKEYS